jgi:hypothetical protein
MMAAPICVFSIAEITSKKYKTRTNRKSKGEMVKSAHRNTTLTVFFW